MKSLRQIRLSRGITLKDMEQSIGINVSFLSEIERGLRSPSILTRHRLNLYFGEKINWFDTVTLKPFKLYQTDWNSTEMEFRSLFRMICGLPTNERKEFCVTAIKHLTRLKNQG